MISKAKNLKESDCALMLSFAAGDGDGFDLLYRRHSESVYRFFYFGTHGDESLASELFQDVWMTVVRGRARYTNEINFTDWLYHSAWARLHDHLRLHPLEREVRANTQEQSTVVSLDAYLKTDTDQDDESAVGDDSEIPAAPIVTKERPESDDRLVKSIENMTPEHKEVVLLRYCFSMSLQDISEFLDVSKVTVERCFKEAVKVLRDDLTQTNQSE